MILSSAEAKSGVPITDPRSTPHRPTVLDDFEAEPDCWPWSSSTMFPLCQCGCNMITTTRINKRDDRSIHAIQDWNLFPRFLIIDGCPEGKSRDPCIGSSRTNGRARALTIFPSRIFL